MWGKWRMLGPWARRAARDPGGNVIAANPPYFSLVVLGPGLYVRRSPLVWKVVPLKFDPMLDGHEVPLQR